jgi:hypothetical protein
MPVTRIELDTAGFQRVQNAVASRAVSDTTISTTVLEATMLQCMQQSLPPVPLDLNVRS